MRGLGQICRLRSLGFALLDVQKKSEYTGYDFRALPHKNFHKNASLFIVLFKRTTLRRARPQAPQPTRAERKVFRRKKLSQTQLPPQTLRQAEPIRVKSKNFFCILCACGAPLFKKVRCKAHPVFRLQYHYTPAAFFGYTRVSKNFVFFK